MGKIFTRIMPGIGNASPYGINFDILSEVIKALPGTTTITDISSQPNMLTFLVEAINDNFIDGTEIVGNWATGYQTPAQGQASAVYTIFKGVTIIDPPTLGQTLTSTHSTGTYTIPNSPPVSIQYSVGGGGSGSAPIHFNLQPPQDPDGNDYSDDLIRVFSDKNKCVCGAAAVGGAHSSWCK